MIWEKKVTPEHWYKRPLKIVSKVPMQNRVFSELNELYEYIIDKDGTIHWMLIGQAFPAKEKTIKVKPYIP